MITAFFAISIGLVFLFCKIATPVFYWLQIILLITYLSIEFAGAYFIRLNFHLTSLNHLNKNENLPAGQAGKIALTFDDGPCNPQTLKTLDTLKKHNVKATFFVIGKNISGNETILKQIIADGHSMGSHSYSHHFWIDLWGSKKLEDDITKGLSEIKSCIGQNVKLFRPPYGVTTPTFAFVLKKLNLQSIGWNVRSYDTSSSDINKILSRVLRQTKNGSVILLHDRLDHMPELLDKLIPALKEKKFEFVTIA
ncbi:MAG TPA: polysaccharide deacetylase family protein [Bacteroidia bacterium]|nr:polysaccharide deacetylase family protein [Bacteroidia bacterium]